MKKIGILAADPGDWTCNALINSVTGSGMKAFHFCLDDAISDIASGRLSAGKIDLKDLDAIIVRDMGQSKKDISFRFDILCQMEELGIPVLNSPLSISRCANKYISSYMFKKNKINTPATIVTNSEHEALLALESFSHAVVKPVFGYKGIGVEKIKYDLAGIHKLKELIRDNSLVYMQEFIPNPGRDIRVFIVNKMILGSIYRIAPSGNWITNLSQGGTARPCKLTGEQEELTLKASKAAGTTFAGVDIIEGDIPYVLEINGTPSGKGIFDACGIDVTVAIVDHLRGLIN